MSWTPPDSPDPSSILHSAVADTQSGAHEDALAKLLWFHHNALRHDRAWFGVRLSFALSYWLQLAEVYAPARDAFVRTRDEAESAFRGGSNFDLFCDLAAMNRELGDIGRTADAFAEVSRRSIDEAKRLYHVAEEYLIAAGRFEECAPFLEPVARLLRAREHYQHMVAHEAKRSTAEPQPPKLAQVFFIRDVGSLIGLLALNHRGDEARRIRDEALTELDNDEVRAAFDAAVSGHLPPQIWMK